MGHVLRHDPVGRHAARFLTDRGAVLVGVADSRGAVHADEGLDFARLAALKAEGRAVHEYPGATRISHEEPVAVPCDVWIPAARSDVLREDNVAALRARLVAPGSDIAVTAGAEKNCTSAVSCASPTSSPTQAA